MANIRQMTHKGVDRIIDSAENLRERGEEGMAQLKEKAIQLDETADGYIRKNPEKAVLIAAGIGAFVGAMLAAAMMRREH